MEEYHVSTRTRALLGLFGVLTLIFFATLYQLQIVNGADYAARSVQKIARTETVEAARGQLLDTYGRSLVSNRLSYQVTLDPSLMGTSENQNQILLQLLDICRQYQVEWNDSTPISPKAPYGYTLAEAGGTARSRFSKLCASMKWSDPTADALLDAIQKETVPLLEDPNPSAQTLLEQMRKTYLVEDSLPAPQARALLGIRYELSLRSKDISRVEYIFAEGVQIDFITAVKEAGLAGVVIEPTTVRQYNTEYAAHLLGRVTSIPDTQLEHYLELGYPMDSKVGRDGIEAAFESYLKGTNGVLAVETNANGKVVSESWLVNSDGEEQIPRPGNHVVLTLDSNLQAAVEQALANHLPSFKEAEGAAAVILDVNSAAILASASYPTYQLSTYSADFNDLNSDPLRPMMNRAFMGLYAPGSTYKMVTAVAALQEKIIYPGTRVVCTGQYTYYSDYQPKCWIFRQYGGTHGAQTVTQAITNSCNIFFFDAGRRLGIDKLGSYARMFGLGEPTGVELPEYTGVVAGPEFTQSLGQRWEQGSTLPAAIGQENNQFTPLQLANYIATLVNGGNHYSAHLLKCIKSNDFSSIVYNREPELLDTINIDPTHLDAVKAGMLELTQSGSVARYFKDLDVKVGAKTGSAQVAADRESHAIFVAFAPYDDPQIALSIVVEYGGSGSEVGAIAADILSYYFQSKGTLDAPVIENTLIQ